MNFTRTAYCAAVSSFLALSSAHAAITYDTDETDETGVEPSEFFEAISLENHPDSQLARTGAPDYGLRLNGYFLESISTKYTFDFEHENSSITLSVDGDEYTISGQIYGGSSLEHNADYLTQSDGSSSEAVWNIEYTLHDVGGSCPASYELCLGNGSGTLDSELGDFALTGMSNKDGFEFAFIDGFRGFDGITGWGWLGWENLDSGTTGKGDFLFATGDPITSEVPLPPAMILFASGIGALISTRKRIPDTKT